MHVTGEDKLLAGTREGDIEFAVDGVPILGEGVGGEEVELIRLLDGERIDDECRAASLGSVLRCRC